MHAIGSLGFAALDVAGYEPFVAWQPHLGLGARLRVARPDAWWVLEANISGERFGGPMTFIEAGETYPQLVLNGSLLRAEVGMRVQFGTRWSPSFYAGLGVQAHLRRTEGTLDEARFSETMPLGAVLALGVGLERRAGDLVLGLDVQVRHGGPDGYDSMVVLCTVGYHLDPY